MLIARCLFYIVKDVTCPKATSNIIIITNPIATPIVPTFECSPS